MYKHNMGNKDLSMILCLISEKTCFFFIFSHDMLPILLLQGCCKLFLPPSAAGMMEAGEDTSRSAKGRPPLVTPLLPILQQPCFVIAKHLQLGILAAII